MPKSVKKLRVARETLHVLKSNVADGKIGNDSCIDSCYLVSCGGGCTISTAIKTA